MSQTKAQLIDPVDGTIVNADINASAAIAGTKITPNFGSQNVNTAGSVACGNITVSTVNPKIFLTDTNNNDDFAIKNNNGVYTITDQTDSVDRFTIDSVGRAFVFENGTGNGMGGFVAATATAGGNAGFGFMTGGTQRFNITTIGSDGSESLRFYDNNNSAERLRIDSAGRLLLGTSSSLLTYGANLSLQVAGTGFSSSSILLRRDSNNANPPAVVFGKSRGSAGGNTIVQNNDQVGALVFAAADGTDLTSVAGEIKVQIDGTPGSNDTPGRIVFGTTADGATSVTERMRISSSGDIAVNFDGSSQTGVFQIADGSASSPSLTFWADGGKDTGIFRSGANTINFSTAGSERLRIDSSGKLLVNGTDANAVHTNADDVIIGNTSASLMGLSIVTSTSGYATLQFSDGGGNKNQGQVAYDHSTNDMQFTTNESLAMTLDSSGRLLIGTTTEGHSNADDLTVNNSANCGITIRSGSSNEGNIFFSDDTSGNGETKGVIKYKHADDALVFNSNGNERMRIDSSGRVLLNASSTGSMLRIRNTNLTTHTLIELFDDGGTGTHSQVQFSNTNGLVGQITTSGSSTTYATSSDYRLKENATAISDGITRLKTLKPYRFNFKADASTTLDGFFAHEVTAVPEAIIGTKDEIDSDNKPVYQGIDQSKLVPLLVAAVKELITKVETLEAA